MHVQEYRDMIDSVMTMASDLKSCVGDEEKIAWGKRAEKLRLTAWSIKGTAKRSTDRDEARMVRAMQLLDEAFHSVEHLLLGDRKLLGI